MDFASHDLENENHWVEENERLRARIAELEAVVAPDTLRETAERLSRAQEIAHLGSWELDVVNDRLTWSDEVYRIFGLKPQEFATTYEAFLEAVHPDDRAAVDEAYSGSIREGRDSYEIEHRVIRRASGEVRFVHEKCQHVRDGTGRIVRSFGMVHDVTDRKQAEASLRESEERFKVLVAATFEGIAITENARFVDANEQLLHMLGYARDELIDREVASTIPPEYRDRVLGNIMRGQESLVEHPMIRRDGTQIIVEAHGRTMLLQRRKIRLTAIRDITERKLIEQERERLLEAERAARTEFERVVRMKDEFLATVSHELRNPLNAIVGWARLLAANKADPAKAVDIISRSAAALNEMVEELLDMSRILSGKIRLKREPANLITLVTDAVESIQFTAEAKAVHIDLSFAPDLQPLECDAGRVRQVINNLLSNAVKFTPPNGRIFVAVSQSPHDVSIAVRDTGKGIAPEFLPYVFERFRQQDGSIAREDGGLGLGLSITRHLVELHGGTICAESRGKDLGASFTVVLPRIELGPPRAAAPPVAASRPQHQPPRSDERLLANVKILSVDDDPHSRELMERVLSDAGAEVRTAGSAQEARLLMQEAPPDVLVCDIGMPEEDGLALIRKLRASGDWQARLPCIAVTALSRPEDRGQALAAGFDEHVGKPFDPGVLTALIYKLVCPICGGHGDRM